MYMASSSPREFEKASVRCENSGPREGHRRRRDGWKTVPRLRKPQAEGYQTRDRVCGDLGQAIAGT